MGAFFEACLFSEPSADEILNLKELMPSKISTSISIFPLLKFNSR